MPYISKETSKLIRNHLKEVFLQYKFSVRIQHHSVLVVTIKSGELDLSKFRGGINEFYYEEFFSAEKKILKLITSIFEAIFEVHPQIIISRNTDYGDWPNYYLDLSIGHNYIQK